MKLLDELDLYMGVAGLSYAGDPRMSVGGENPFKVRNLVIPVLKKYRTIYENAVDKICGKVDLELITDINDHHHQVSDRISRFSIEQSSQMRANLLQYLPKTVVNMLGSQRLGHPPGNSNNNNFNHHHNNGIVGKDFKHQLLNLNRKTSNEAARFVRSELQVVLKTIVAGASSRQSIKAVVTVGINKCVKYIGMKMSKNINARFNQNKSSNTTSLTILNGIKRFIPRILRP